MQTIGRDKNYMSQKYRASHSNKRYLQYVEVHTDQLKGNICGAKYETGVTITLAKYAPKDTLKRNPLGILITD